MMVIFSDVHLCDETVSSNVSPSVFELLAREITAALSGNRKRARSLEFLLLGDIIDFYRTSYWQEQHVPFEQRPWNGTLSDQTAINSLESEVKAQFLAILKRVIATEACGAFLSFLNSIHAPGGRKPTVFYVVGNHDRPLSTFPILQNELRSQLDGVEINFLRTYSSSEYRVLARHGHEWDPNNYGWTFLTKVLKPGSRIDRFASEVNNVQCIGDVITAELVSGCLYRLKQELSNGSPDDRAFLKAIYEINNFRPLTSIFEWISWFSMNRPAAEKTYLELLRKALHDCLEVVLDSQLARRWDRLRADFVLFGDLTDQLARAHALLKRKNGLRLLAGLKPLMSTFMVASDLKPGPTSPDVCLEGAISEFARLSKSDSSVQYIFYGHTHESRLECIDSKPDGRLWLYVNTGTFLPFIQRGYKGHGFWGAHRFSYAFLYGEDEDKSEHRGVGPMVDIWNGLRCRHSLV